MIASVSLSVTSCGPGLRDGHAFGRLSRRRVVDYCIVQSSACMP